VWAWQRVRAIGRCGGRIPRLHHSFENLRGIPKTINSDVHLSQIRREWNQFYRQNPAPTQQQLLQKATEIDAKFGSQFQPPR